MNTAFGLFNLGVAIRKMRPDDSKDQGYAEGVSEESALRPTDYSLLTNRSVGAEYVLERSASATGKGVGQCGQP
jgi:PBP1b-binding outer membrane lipoprotein LpoB